MDKRERGQHTIFRGDEGGLTLEPRDGGGDDIVWHPPEEPASLEVLAAKGVEEVEDSYGRFVFIFVS